MTSRWKIFSFYNDPEKWRALKVVRRMGSTERHLMGHSDQERIAQVVFKYKRDTI